MYAAMDADKNSYRLFYAQFPGGTGKPVAPGCQAYSPYAVWSPDSSRILFTGGCHTKDYVFVSTPGGKPIPSKIDFHPPSGGTLVFDEWLPSPSRVLFPMPDRDNPSIGIAPISADGTRAEGPIRRLTFGTGAERHVSAAAGGLMVFSSIQSDQHIWGLPIDANGHATEAPKRLTGGWKEVAPAFSRDGRGLAFLSQSAGGMAMYYRDLESGGDADRFFGRDLEKQIAADNLRASRLTVLYGQSGVGKSSLLRAGVFPLLNGYASAAREFGVMLLQDWRTDPVLQLWQGAEAHNGESLEATLQRRVAESGSELLLILDQFEDFFQYGHAREGNGSLLAQLPLLLASEEVEVHLLIGIREDALALLDSRPRPALSASHRARTARRFRMIRLLPVGLIVYSHFEIRNNQGCIEARTAPGDKRHGPGSRRSVDALTCRSRTCPRSTCAHARVARPCAAPRRRVVRRSRRPRRMSGSPERRALPPRWSPRSLRSPRHH